MIYKYLLLLGISFWIWACGSGTDQVKLVDVRKVENTSVLKWSQIATEERLVRLETNDEALLDNYFQVWVGKKYIITYGNDDMHQFTADGRHIRKLATYGRGPAEYQSVMALTVDEQRNRLYFSDYGSQSTIRVLNLENGNEEKQLPMLYGVPVKMVLSEDSVLYCMPLRLKDTEYELYRLSVSGYFLGGIKRMDSQKETLKHSGFLGVSGKKIHYMYGVTDTLYQWVGEHKNPEYCFQVGHSFSKYTPGEKAEQVAVILETPQLLLLNHMFLKVGDLSFGRYVTTYDENRDPEICMVNKADNQISKMSSLYLDNWGKELEDYDVNVSEEFVCHVFNAIEFREMIKEPDSPYHHWYNEMTDEDNPVLLIGKIHE